MGETGERINMIAMIAHGIRSKSTRFLLLTISLMMLLIPLANAVTLPANVIYFSAIKINNVQTSALPPNAQIPVSYNALKYQATRPTA